MNAVALPAHVLSGTDLSAALRAGIYRLISREEVINKSQDPTTILAKLQELDLAQAVDKGGGKGGKK